jgi:hypothetical protein
VNAMDIAVLITAGAAILGSIGSVLLLAYRVGRLTGSTEARITHGETDRSNLWRALGELMAKVDRHIETPHRQATR